MCVAPECSYTPKRG